VGEDGQELRAELWVRLTVGGSQPADREWTVLERCVVREPDNLAVPADLEQRRYGKNCD
jgi:hypothetical protein